MKIRTLFLRAFGPFTDTVLDFSGKAGVHLIYGANEAGKSSALRAITDLRYGIPARSKDDFVHQFKDLLLAGCFEDAAGRSHGLARRKGNRDTLMVADPVTGELLTGTAASPASPEVLLALTGGVTRERFETMYGLDAQHLRQGGRQLISGDGDAGVALFEASTGSAGIRQLLQALQKDARKYFVPRGQLPLLNEAARQLDEARQRYKLAVIRPEQWKALKRVHVDAASRLEALRRELTNERRRLAGLTELRAVGPLLRELDLAERQWAAVQAGAALPAQARDDRLAAVARQAQARGALAEADHAIAECAESLRALRIEEALLAHAPAIDRLAADFALLRREQDGRLKLQSAADHEKEQLSLRAGRMTNAGDSLTSLDEFFRRTPSAADHAEVERLLEVARTLTHELRHVRDRQDAAERRLAGLRREAVAEPAPALGQALSLALAQARSLGDAPARLDALQAEIGSGQRRLEQSLSDLGLASAEQLASSRWLPAGEIDAYERERGGLQHDGALNQSRLAQLQADLALQKRRFKMLAATGEVVTADTLRQSRIGRDEGWRAVRAAFIDPQAQTAAGSGLLGEFERLQFEADRQADLLREGAMRAAEIAECEQRIGEMTPALLALEHAKAELSEALAALDGCWNQTLARLGLPAGTAAAVREWLVLRQGALERGERLAQATRTHSQLEGQVARSCDALRAALRSLDHMPAALSEAAPALDALVALGTVADRDLVAMRQAAQRRRADIAGLEQDIEAGRAGASELAARLRACHGEVGGRCRTLGLDTGADADTLKSRLAELREWVSDYQAHALQRRQLEQMRVGEAATGEAAALLGRLLGEPVWEHAGAWLDGLTLRLAQSRDAAAMKAALEGRQADEGRRREQAAADLRGAADALGALVALAGVCVAEELPQAEALSDQRREAQARLRDLRDQLARTSPKDAEMLRQELARLDSVSIDAEKDACEAGIAALEAEEKLAIDGEQTARAGLARIDTSGEAAQAREEMESAIARYRAGVRPWAQLKLAEALLVEALRRHREKAQAPVVALAGDYFRLMTGGRFARLLIDDEAGVPVLLAQPAQGGAIGISGLSEGTADQLYLSLRLAALELQRRPDRLMPLVLDDVFMTADDERAAQMFRALEKFAAAGQVLVFTHHHHLLDIASGAVSERALRLHRLEAGVAGRAP